MVDWIHVGPAVTAAFLGSLVEFVEALTIVLAVGTVRGWQPAILGAGGGLLVLAVLVGLLGPALGAIPIGVLQVVVGILLLLFGMRWLRKAVLRAAAVVPLHDEAEAYVRQRTALHPNRIPSIAGWDTLAMATTFKAVVLEGLEVVFIVLAVGAVGNMLIPASAGAAVAGLVVVLLGLALHRPLARVPENTLKFTVGVLIAGFGVFWVGEGFGFHWPGDDLSILGLASALLLASLAMIPAAGRRRGGGKGAAVSTGLTATTRRVFGLFVDDGSLALSILAWVLVAPVLLPRAVGGGWAPPILFLGCLAILLENVLRAARRTPQGEARTG